MRRPSATASGWTTTLTVKGRQISMPTPRGKETKAKLAEPIEVGLFEARPGLGAFSSKDVIVMEQRAIAQRDDQKTSCTTRPSPSSPASTPIISISTATATIM